MEIICHRGFWSDHDRPNSLGSFRHAEAAGFGIETDFRDLGGQLVISHDPPKAAHDLSASELFSSCPALGRTQKVAVNIKADGLQTLLGALIRQFGLTDFFLFDASVPDLIQSWRLGLPFYTRHSEFETPVLYEPATGVWLDGFDRDWFDETVVRDHLSHGKEVAIVSPELHHRDHQSFWAHLRTWSPRTLERVILCTDLPEEAKGVFA